MDNSHRKVSFAQSCILFFKNYAKFSGRSSRSAYWFWTLWTVIYAFFIMLLNAFSGDSSILDLVQVVFNVAILLPSYALAARRLHDVGRSGWWQLIAITIVGLIPLFLWFVTEGDSETNKYGDNVEQGV